MRKKITGVSGFMMENRRAKFRRKKAKKLRVFMVYYICFKWYS